MKAKALLTLACRDSHTRAALGSVLAPDNEGGPSGLKISLEGRGRRLSIDIQAETSATLVSTCLAFLRDVALFQEVWLLSQPVRA